MNTESFPGSRAVRETRDAVCVFFAGRERWVPKSVIHDDSEVWKAGQSGKLVVLHWWADKNGLIK